MSKIIVRRQEYANNGTHANEIEAVVKENLIANTLSSATDIAPSVGLLKSVSDAQFYDNAEVVSFNTSDIIFGFASNGKTALYCKLPLMKQVKKSGVVSITGDFYIRSGSGVQTLSSTVISSITSANKSANGVTFNIALSEAIDVDANTPLFISASGTITF